MTKDCILQNTNGGILFRNPSIVMHILHRKKVFFLVERWKKKEKLWRFPGVTLLFAGWVVGLHKDLVSSKAKMSIGNLPVLSKV